MSIAPPPAPDVLPRPRHVVRFDPTARSAAPLEVEVDPALPAQGYELHVEADTARLTHRDDAGRRYGEQAVAQLRAADGSLPTVHLRDHPDIATRGYMLDVSRDRVPTRATLERLVGILATARLNHLQLYVEHTFAYRDHEEVWRDASPLTPHDLRWLDGLCAAHGIELAANQNCFGHMGRWLSHDGYRGRAECPDGTEVAPGIPWPPGVLAPSAENAAFAVSLVREQQESLRSHTANVGCDETFELGRGVSSARVAEVGKGRVYGEHLRRIVEPLLADGSAVQVWADVLAHHPDARALLPAGDVTALVWNYDAPDAPTPSLPPALTAVLADIGIDVTTPTDFATRLAPFVDGPTPVWVLPGTSTWCSLVGRLDNALPNLLDAARTARDAGIDGLLITDWGDGGHHQPPSVSDPAILYGGAVAWCADANSDLDVAAAVDRHVVGDPTGTIGRVLAEVGSLGSRTGVVARNCSPLAAALLPHQPLLTSGRADPDAMAEVIAVLDSARDDLTRARPSAPDGATAVAELDVAIGLARHGALRLASSAGGPAVDPAAMADDLRDLVDRFREVWLERSRPGGLADSAAHLERSLRSYDR